MYNAKRLDQGTFEGQMYSEEMALRTLFLLVKLKEKKNKYNESSFDCYIKTGSNKIVKFPEGDTLLKKSGGGLPSKYVDMATLPLNVLREIKSLPMCQYNGGKLLAYIGDYIPHHTGSTTTEYKGEPLFAKELDYIFKVYC